MGGAVCGVVFAATKDEAIVGVGLVEVEAEALIELTLTLLVETAGVRISDQLSNVPLLLP